MLWTSQILDAGRSGERFNARINAPVNPAMFQCLAARPPTSPLWGNTAIAESISMPDSYCDLADICFNARQVWRRSAF